jgi:hypothetical protein
LPSLREQALAKPGALDGLEVLLGDDHVGVDIDDLQGRRDAFQRGELVHLCTSSEMSRFGLLCIANMAAVEERNLPD